MKKTIIFDSNLIILDVDPDESDEIVYDRINFIIKHKNKIGFDKLLILSKLYVNKKYKHLDYSEEVELLFNDNN